MLLGHRSEKHDATLVKQRRDIQAPGLLQPFIRHHAGPRQGGHPLYEAPGTLSVALLC